MPAAPPPAGIPEPRPPRRRARLIVATGVLAITAAGAAVVIGSPGDTPAVVTAVLPADPTPMPLVDCQFTVAAQTDPNVPATCGYATDGTGSAFDEPEANLADPRFFGAALPDILTTDGAACVLYTPPPVTVDTVYPMLSASFVQIPGLRRIEPTFQIRGAFSSDSLVVERAGSPVGVGQPAELDLRLIQPLQQGATYEWRVRGTPQRVAGGDWSPWCEFTVAEKTTDDLGLDDAVDYPVALPATSWRTVLKVLGPVETEVSGDDSIHEPIATAVEEAAGSTESVRVTLPGRNWALVVDRLAQRASQDEEPEYWAVVGALSSALGGHPHPTMGLPRPAPEESA
jgi:hypothetical protein